jgi:hypothetical protein
MDAAIVARRVVGPNRTAYAVRSLDRKDVAEIGNAAVPAVDLGRSWRGKSRKRDEGDGCGAPQWCSMTRSTMLYSFASSALMK